MKHHIYRQWNLAVVLILAASCLVLTPLGFAEAPGDESTSAHPASEPEVARAACREQLEQIGAAIAAYRNQHGDLPLWLSDLLEADLIHDPDLLVCPVTRTTGELPELARYFSDPQVSGSYFYEFAPRAIGGGTMSGGTMTMRQWKEHQRELAGALVPMVRCTMHGRVLNIGVDGDFFEGGLDWESEVLDPELRRKLRDSANSPFAKEGANQFRQTAEAMIGVQAPELQLELLDGGLLDLAELTGRKVVVLDFWTTWCVPCAETLVYLEEIAAKYEGRQVAFFSVNLQEDPAKVRRYIQQRELKLSVALDPLRRAAWRYGVQPVPHAVVIGLDGVVAGVLLGSSRSYAEDLEKIIESCL